MITDTKMPLFYLILLGMLGNRWTTPKSQRCCIHAQTFPTMTGAVTAVQKGFLQLSFLHVVSNIFLVGGRFTSLIHDY